MSAKRSGVVNLSVIVGIVVAVIVALGAWYFTSDVFRTKVDEAAKQATTWTPENIAKDPVNYLNWCETQTKNAVQQLRADRIAIAQNRAKFQAMKDESANKVNVGSRALVELKKAYEAGKTAAAFPVEYQGAKRDEEWIKAQIVSLFKQVETQKNIVSRVEAGLKNLDIQEQKISKAEGDATAQLAEIAANREMLKVQKLTDDLKVKLVSMQGAVQGVVSVAGQSSGAISLDQLAAESAQTVDSAEFDKVLTNIK